jgi:hypothetical protein
MPSCADTAPPDALVGDSSAIAWLSLFPLTIIFAVCVLLIAPALIDPLRLRPPIARDVLPTFQPSCNPKPLEQLRTLLALTTLPLAAWAWVWLAGRITLRSPLARKAVGVGAIAAQIAFLAFAAAMWLYQNEFVKPWFDAIDLSRGVAILAGAALARYGLARYALARYAVKRHAVKRGPLAGGAALPEATSPESAGSVATQSGFAKRATVGVMWTAAILIAAMFTAYRMRPAFFPGDDLLRAGGDIAYHLPWTSGEFAAILDGKTLLVDFFPWYQNLLPYFLAPVFGVVGFSWGSFTAAMMAISIIAILWQLDVFRRLTPNPWAALTLFIPYVAFSTALCFSGGYYAVAPLRYIAPWTAAPLLAWYLDRGSAWRSMTLFAAMGICLANNLDFGLPTVAAVWVATILIGERPSDRQARHATRMTAQCVAGAAMGFALLTIITLIRSGYFPRLGMMLQIPRTFAVDGFDLVPMPIAGLHLLQYATFLAAAVAGVTLASSANGAASNRSGGDRAPQSAANRAAPTGADRAAPAGAHHPEQDDARGDRFAATSASSNARIDRILAGLLIFSGGSGFGTILYFSGRSAPSTLSAVFPAWAMAIMLLVCAQCRAVFAGGIAIDSQAVNDQSKTIDPRRWNFSSLKSATLASIDRIPSLQRLPTLMLLAAYALCASYALTRPTGGTVDSPRPAMETKTYEKWAPRINQIAAPGEAIFLAMPFGHQIARDHGLRDDFPFASPLSMVLTSQADLAIDLLRRTGDRKLFGTFWPEFQLRLYDEGFDLKSEDRDCNITSWEKVDWSRAAPEKLAEMHHRRGGLLMQLGRAPDAPAEFELSLRLNPASSETHFDYGFCLAGLGADAAAEGQFRAAVALDPAGAEASDSLANILLRERKYADASSVAESILKKSPTDVSALEADGYALLALGRPAEAANVLRRAAALKPGDSDIDAALYQAIIATGQGR